MTSRLARVALVLLAVPAAAPARNAVPESRIRESLRAAWDAVAPAGAVMEILAVPRLVYPGGEPELDVAMLAGLEHPGPRAIAIGCRVDGRTVARGLANVMIRVERTVWITPVELARGAEIDPAGLRSEVRSFDREPRLLFAPVPGREYRTLRDVDAGAVLKASQVRAIPDVEAGAVIRLVSRVGQAEVAVPGRARRSGDVGDTILVHNSISGELVPAVVVDRGTAVLVTPTGGKS